MARLAIQAQETTKDIQRSVQDMATDRRLERIHHWLSPPNPWRKYDETLKRRHEGSGAWLIKDNKNFREWQKQQNGGSMLWLFGIPGCGKTVLSCTIIEHTLAECGIDSEQLDGLAFHFFDFREDETQSVDKMLRSFIDQLARQSVSAFNVLEELYIACRSKERQPTLDELLMVLHDIVNRFRCTCLILDALDECNQFEERAQLIDILAELEIWHGVRLLTTSRPENDIKSAMESSAYSRTSICVESVLVQEDIRAYVHDRLRTDPSLKRWRNNPQVQERIEKVLTDKANGM